jgi:hypothetical protein
MCSPLPSLSPMPTRGSILSNRLDDTCLQADAFMQHPDVLKYQNDVNQAIEDKLKVCTNTPKTPKSVFKRLISDCSPYLQSSGTPKRDLRSVRHILVIRKMVQGGPQLKGQGMGECPQSRKTLRVLMVYRMYSNVPYSYKCIYCMFFLHICIYVFIYMCTYIHVYVYTYICIYIYKMIKK